MRERIITSEACLREGIKFLSDADTRLKNMFNQVGPIALRLRKPGFSNLISVIVSQQISVAAAAAILKRMGPKLIDSEMEIINSTDGQLREIGLSKQKIKYVRSLAEAQFDYDSFEQLESEEVIQILTQVKGIGRWTAEIYLMFSLGRADIIAAGDLALQEACKTLYDLSVRPSEKEIREIAEAWRPWRAVAARGLWAYYSYNKNREGII